MGRAGAPAVIKPAELLPTVTVRTATGVAVRLRAGTGADAAAWSRLRLDGRRHLEPWEPQLDEPWEAAYRPRRWRRAEKQNRLAMRAGLALPAVIEADGAFAGQMTIGGIVRGPNQTAWIGYWVGEPFCRRGVATAAAALAVDLAFGPLRLARLEATCRPENAGSRAVLEAVGFRTEGVLRNYLQVDGARRDHLLYGAVAPAVGGAAPPGAIELLRARGKLQYAP